MAGMTHPSSFPIEIGGEHFLCRELQESDSTALVTLHQVVFGNTFHLGWYHWKYQTRHNPTLGLWNSQGELIAHCAGISRELYLQGLPCAGLQICDVMVHPQWRGIFTRRGPFFWVSRTFYEQYIGKDRPYSLGYGFPSYRHLQLAAKLDLLSDAGTIWELTWQQNQEQLTPHPWHWQVLELQEGSSLWSSHLQSAWEVMRNHSQSIQLGDRSPKEIDWRYRQHPSHRHYYTALKRPWSKKIRGIAIWRYTDNHTVLWLDWIGSPEDLARAQRMLAHHVLRGQVNKLQTWASQWIRSALRHTPHYSEKSVARIGIPNTSCIDLKTLEDQPWWWMAGDTDFL